MPAALVPDITAWLGAEATAVAATPAPTTSLQTAAIALPSGAGSIDLPAPAGAKITFTASLDTGILTLKDVTLVAPAASGVHAAGVHIDLVDATGVTTQNESFAGTDNTAPKGGSVPIGLGLAVVPRVASADQLRLSFDVLESSDGGGGTTTATLGGCKNVASYQANAVPAIQANTCLNCHNSGGSGNGALDMSGLAANPPDYARACAQALSKIDATNPAQSPIILAPTGGIAAHPFKNANAQFTTMMTTWITAEK
jgi:hypothetical protein